MIEPVITFHKPWAWAIEPVNGCNLKCGHCATRLFPKGRIRFIKEKVWRDMFHVIKEVSPRCRVEMAMAGEPLLHPDMLHFLRIAREISPDSQIQITTNGTMLLAGKYKYKDLFQAGANIIYTDMYGPRDEFRKLANQSGELWYEYHNKPKDAPGAWTYSGPDLRLITLMEHPGNWPNKRKHMGRLGTFYNNLDWKAAEEFNLHPVTKPPFRRCNQPSVYSVTNYQGKYLLCCQDLMSETAGMMGEVSSGAPGFLKYWLGEKMQDVRRKLRSKCRVDISECSRCAITFSRCDMPMWKDDPLDHYWNGSKWILLKRWIATKPPVSFAQTRKGFNLMSK